MKVMPVYVSLNEIYCLSKLSNRLHGKVFAILFVVLFIP